MIRLLMKYISDNNLNDELYCQNYQTVLLKKILTIKLLLKKNLHLLKVSKHITRGRMYYHSNFLYFMYPFIFSQTCTKLENLGIKKILCPTTVLKLQISKNFGVIYSLFTYT